MKLRDSVTFETLESTRKLPKGINQNTLGKLKFYRITLNCEMGHANKHFVSINRTSRTKKFGCPATIRFRAENRYLKVVKIIEHSNHAPRMKKPAKVPQDTKEMIFLMKKAKTKSNRISHVLNERSLEQNIDLHLTA